MKKIYLTAIMLTLGTTALLLAKVNTDFDKGADWSRFHTYSWIKVQAEDELWNDRISQAINGELTAKGWRMVPSGAMRRFPLSERLKTNKLIKRGMTDSAADGVGDEAG